MPRLMRGLSGGWPRQQLGVVDSVGIVRARRSNSMELRHLRYLVAVAEEGTFVRASQRLRLAQPALSRQIRDLERELGIELVERRPRALRLTPAGEGMLRCAREIMRQTAKAIEYARSSSRGLAGRCVICVGKVPIWNGFTARLVTRLQRDFPLIDIEIVEGAGARQWEMLRSGEADIGIGVEPTDDYPDLASEPAFSEVVDAVLLSASHPLAGVASVRLADLAEATPVTFPDAAAGQYSQLVREALARAGVDNEVRPSESVIHAVSLISAGLAWCAAPRSMQGWAPMDTVVVPTADLRFMLPMCAITRAGDDRGAVRTVVRLIRELGEAWTDAQDPAPHAGPPPIPVPTEVPVGLELRHLRYFLGVVEAGSFGQAASRLGLTQPALSRQVRDLEHHVGERLLDREARGVRLTSAGEVFAAEAGKVLAIAARVESETRRAVADESRRCVIATIHTPAVSRMLSRVLRQYESELQGTDLGLTEVPTTEQPRALHDGSIDVGICHSYRTPSEYDEYIERHRLVNDAVDCALVALDHPLATRPLLTLADLGDAPFLFMPRALYPGFYDEVMETFAARGYRPRIEAAYDGLETIWALAREGRGWTLGLRSERRGPPANLAAVPLEGFELPWGLDVLHRRDETRGSTLAMVSLIRQAADEEDDVTPRRAPRKRRSAKGQRAAT